MFSALVVAFSVYVSAPSAEATAAEPAAAASTVAASKSDPLEGFNRRTYKVNEKLDRYLLRPVAVGYQRLFSKSVRRHIHNAINNWDEPGILVNDLLQRRFSDAGRTSFRFAVNSTIGLFGAFDVAASRGVTHHENSFAITLGRYGVGSGPYVYLPIAGPSSVRDAFGAGVDLFTNPLTTIRGIRSTTIERAETVFSVVDARARVDDDLRDLAVTATDPYASLRSIYQQKVEAQIAGDAFSLGDSPEIPGAPEPAPTPPAPPPKPPAAAPSP